MKYPKIIDKINFSDTSLYPNIIDLSGFKSGCFEIRMRGHFSTYSFFDCLYKGKDAAVQRVSFGIRDVILREKHEDLKAAIIENSAGRKCYISEINQRLVSVFRNDFIMVIDRGCWRPTFTL